MEMAGQIKTGNASAPSGGVIKRGCGCKQDLVGRDVPGPPRLLPSGSPEVCPYLPRRSSPAFAPFRIIPKEGIGGSRSLRYPYGRNDTPNRIPDGGPLAK